MIASLLTVPEYAIIVVMVAMIGYTGLLMLGKVRVESVPRAFLLCKYAFYGTSFVFLSVFLLATYEHSGYAMPAGFGAFGCLFLAMVCSSVARKMIQRENDRLRKNEKNP